MRRDGVDDGRPALVKSLYREAYGSCSGCPASSSTGGGGAAPGAGIRFIVTRHEQATAYMADGFARTAAASLESRWWCPGRAC